MWWGRPMAKPKPARESAFGEDEEPIPYIPVSEVNPIYEKGFAGLSTAKYIDPLEVKNEALAQQVADTETEKEAWRQHAEQLQEQLAAQASGITVQDGGLVVQGFQFSPTGLIAPEDVSFEAWEQVGGLLFRLEGSIQWLIGDWLLYGADLKYGDIKQIADAMERSEQTFYNIMDVCRGVESSRRREHLSFAHHAEVKKLSPENQTWALEFAESARYNVKDFRKWIKIGMPEAGLPKEITSGSSGGVDPIEITEEIHIRPLLSAFKSLMQKDPVQAEEYVTQIERATAEMRAQLKGHK